MKATRSTIWVEWDPVMINTREQDLDQSSVMYYLYRKGGFITMIVGDRVLVAQSSQSIQQYLGGVITCVNRSGSYTVKYDNQWGIEHHVARDRLTKMKPIETADGDTSVRPLDPTQEVCTINVDPFEWKLVYSGNATSYACTNLVPFYYLERNPEYSAKFEFVLQVQGVDYPLYERSLLSDPVTFETAKDINKVAEGAKPRKEILRFTGHEQKEMHIERRDVVYSAVGTFDHFV